MSKPEFSRNLKRDWNVFVILNLGKSGLWSGKLTHNAVEIGNWTAWVRNKICMHIRISWKSVYWAFGKETTTTTICPNVLVQIIPNYFVKVHFALIKIDKKQESKLCDTFPATAAGW